jgi:hypothetical protein
MDSRREDTSDSFIRCRVRRHGLVAACKNFTFRSGLPASSEGRSNLCDRGLLLNVAGLLLGALAAAPGCMKMLRIFCS